MSVDLFADVVVVGGGTAGAIVASRLIGAGATLALLEAGPDPGPQGSPSWPRDVLDPTRVATSHDWGYAGPAADGRTLPLARARILGGCSSHNGCTQSIGLRADWDALGIAALKADRIQCALSSIREQLRITTPRLTDLSPFHRDVLLAAGNTGHRRTDDLLDLDGRDGASISPVNVAAGIRWNNAFAFIDPLRHSSSFTVIGDALVARLVFRSGAIAAVDVFIRGVLRRIHTSSVVLCAGAFGTPEILLRSGIGPADDLRALGIDVVLDQHRVGADLADHPVATLVADVGRDLATRLESASIAQEISDEGVVLKTRSQKSNEPYDAHLFPWTEPNPTANHRWSAVLGVALLRPRSRGRLSLKSADPTIRSTVNLGYLTELADVAGLLDAVRSALPLWNELDLDVSAVASQCRIATGPAAEAWLVNTHAHYWHPVGGAVAGLDPNAVVDDSFRVRGLSGLFVADASAFSAPPRATTALPVSILAWQAAGHVA
jgi:choline dehydrogenase